MDNIKGAVLMVVAMAGFAIEDAFVKAATQTIPLGEMLTFLDLGGGLIFAVLVRRKGLPLFGRAFFTRAAVVRNLGEVIATACFVASLMLIPLSLLSALIQASPLFVTLGAIVVMGEAVGWRRWAAIAAGMIGVLVILRPGFEGFEPAALLGLIAAVGLAVRDLSTRLLPGHVHSLQIGVWGFSILCPVGLLMSFATGEWVLPGWSEAAMILGALVTGTAGYYAIILSMRMGEISAVTPFRYSRLVFALALAWVFFDERPDALMLVGAAIVVASGVYTLMRERKVRRLSAMQTAAGPDLA